MLVAVPRMIESLKAHIEDDSLTKAIAAAGDLKFWKRWLRFHPIHTRFGWKFWAFVSGGAALDAATEELWRRLGFVVVQGYGMTETTSLISLNHPFGVQRGSIGKALPGRELKVDESGEILVRGDSVASAYWQDGELKPVRLRMVGCGQEILALSMPTAICFSKGAENVIVTPEGMNVYPQDLETALRAQPEVKDCVVLPLPRGSNAVPGVVLLLESGDSNPDADLYRGQSRCSAGRLPGHSTVVCLARGRFPPHRHAETESCRPFFSSPWIDSAEPRLVTPPPPAPLRKSSLRSRSVRRKTCPASVHWSALNL